MIFRDTLDITRGDLEWAASQGLLTQEQVEPLWNQWRARQQADDRAPRFSASNVSYYIGTCIIALGMIWLLYLAWDKEWGGMVVFGIAAAYDVVLYTSGNYLWHKRGQKRLAGLLLFIAILIVPIAVYGLQYQMGWWYRPPDVNPYNYNPIEYMSTRKEMLNLLPMELSAVVATFVTLIFYPFPFLLTVPLCIGWFMAVTWAQYSLGFDDDSALACLVYGILCFVCAFRLDQVYSVADGPDWAFWPYFVGAISFWSGLAFNSIVYEKELYQFLFCLINVGIILVAVALKRRIFMVLGAIGTFAYILHLNDRFGDFVLFPFFLTLLGGFVVSVGVCCHRRAQDESMTQLLLDAENHETATGGLSMHDLEGGTQAVPSSTTEASSAPSPPQQQQAEPEVPVDTAEQA